MPPSLEVLRTAMEPFQSQPLKTGHVYLSQRTGGKGQQTRVVLSVYSSKFEHYAVISQDNVICKDCGFLNLKHCKARKTGITDGSFEIISKDGDKGSIVIIPASSSDCESWVTAVNDLPDRAEILPCCRRVATRGQPPCLPTLAEEGPDE